MQMNDKPKKKKKLKRGRVKSTRERIPRVAVTLGTGIHTAVSCHPGGFTVHSTPHTEGAFARGSMAMLLLKVLCQSVLLPKAWDLFFLGGGGSGLC